MFTPLRRRKCLWGLAPPTAPGLPASEVAEKGKVMVAIVFSQSWDTGRGSGANRLGHYLREPLWQLEPLTVKTASGANRTFRVQGASTTALHADVL